MTFKSINIQMKHDMLTFSCQQEITCPKRQRLYKVKTIKFQIHLSILNLAEIKNTSY